MRFDPGAPQVILSPHLDDAVLSCWSVLTADEPVTVANVFAGVPRDGPPGEWDALCGAREAPLHVQDRLREDVRALVVAGREAIYLPFVEDQYRNLMATPSNRRIDAQLVASVPAASRVYAPLAAYHIDHIMVKQYALALLSVGIPVSVYAELPFGVPVGWPHWVLGEPAQRHLCPDLVWETALAELGPDAPPPRAVKLSEAESERKLEALKAYATQFPALDRGPVGVLRNPVMRGHEVFWDLNGRTA